MPSPTSGRSGTITNEEFGIVESLVLKYGAETIVKKVAKVCKKKAKALSHEYAASPVAAGYTRLASSIETLFPTPRS